MRSNIAIFVAMCNFTVISHWETLIWIKEVLDIYVYKYILNFYNVLHITLLYIIIFIATFISGKYNKAAGGDWKKSIRSQHAYFEGD